MPEGSYDVAVVGGGIIGCACAMELARAGQRVVVLEALEVASDASCRAMGHVGVYDDSAAQFALTQFARQLWDEAEAELPPEVEFVRRGALWIAADEDEMRDVSWKRSVYRAASVDAFVVERERLHEMEPNLRPDLPGALYVPGDIVVDAAESTRFFARRAGALGAEFRLKSRVRSLEPGGVRLANGSTVSARRTVLATGWQAPHLLPELPIRPRKGHIVRTVARPGFVRHQLTEVGYVRGTQPDRPETITFTFQPRQEGWYLLGATRQYVGDSTDVDPAVIQRLIDRARIFLPAIDDLPIDRTWTGLRPAGPDSVPLIGPMPGRPGLLLAVAHEGIGITTSIATGRLIAQIATEHTPTIPLGPLLPDRLFSAENGGPPPIH